MAKPRLPILIDPTEEQLHSREPLLKFSFYLSSLVNVPLERSGRIMEALDTHLSNQGRMNAGAVGEADVDMWFWTLGAYEVA